MTAPNVKSDVIIMWIPSHSRNIEINSLFKGRQLLVTIKTKIISSTHMIKKGQSKAR